MHGLNTMAALNAVAVREFERKQAAPTVAPKPVTYEIRVTVELLNADSLGDALETEVCLTMLEDGDVEAGFYGDVEAAIHELLSTF